MKKLLSLALATFASATALLLPVSANSAQTHWRGVDSTGAIVTDKNCPIQVKQEVLTLDIPSFPAEYYQDKNEYLAYDAKVTAEYTFYNPTDLTVTATLAFPFGKQPDYASIYDEKTQSYVTNVDTEKYQITVDGEAVEKKIRYTLQTDRPFDLTNDLPKLLDDYVSDPFYSPAMTVTKYTYLIGGIDTERYHAATVAFDWDGGDGSTRLYFPDQHGFHTQKNGDGRFSTWADNGKTFEIYAIGSPFSAPLTMKCYEDGGVKNKEEIEGKVTLKTTETMTLEELALTHWTEDTGVSRVDWYNAVIDSFDEELGDNAKYHYVSDNHSFHLSAQRVMESLMRWYEYEITIPPKGSIVNTVTAPLYPAIDTNYEPDVYTYTYLLSPASTWASFGRLEIRIHTPFYVTEHSLASFEKTDSGYTLTRNGLPEGELTFTLCSVENPTKPVRTPRLPIEFLIGFSILGGILVLIGVGITLLLLHNKKRKKTEGSEVTK